MKNRADTIRQANWLDVAQQLATEAKRTTMLRRFFGEFKADDSVFVYIGNGNPYSSEPNLRKAEHQLFREWCEKEKITVLTETSERVEDIVIIILDLGDSVADCKRFVQVFSKYTGIAASSQAFELARQLNDFTERPYL